MSNPKINIFTPDGKKVGHIESSTVIPLSDKEIDTIENVLLYNVNLFDMLKEKGISKFDIERLCDQARSEKRLKW